MNRLISVSCCALVAFVLFTGCAHHKAAPTTLTSPSSEEVIKKVPDWYVTIPSDAKYAYASGTATSRDLQLARDKASEAARFNLAKDIETKMEGVSKRFQEEVGTAADAQYLDQFTQASKAVVSQVLTATSIDKTDIQSEGGIYRVYVLLRQSSAAAGAALAERLKQQEQMYTRFRATQTFQELEKDVEKFEQFKRDQQSE